MKGKLGLSVLYQCLLTIISGLFVPIIASCYLSYLCLYRFGSVRLDTLRFNNTSLLHPGRTEEEKNKTEEERRSAELGNTKETLGVPTSLYNFPTSPVAPYWINQTVTK